MSFSQPTPPDPYALASAQTGLNTAAAQTAAGLSEGNVLSPLGSTIVSGAGGANPTYTQTLSPAQQGLLQKYQGTQGQAGGLASEISQGLGQSGLYSGGLPNFTSMTSPLVQAQMQAMNPLFAQQESNLKGQLANQGIGAGPGGPGGIQGTDAYSNAMRQQMTSEDQALAANLPTFAQLGMQQYQLPIQTMQGLFGMSAPQGVTPPQPVQQYSTQNPQPAPLGAYAEQNYAQQNQQFQNTMGGLGNIGTAGITGLFGLKNPGGGSWLVG